MQLRVGVLSIHYSYLIRRSPALTTNSNEHEHDLTSTVSIPHSAVGDFSVSCYEYLYTLSPLFSYKMCFEKHVQQTGHNAHSFTAHNCPLS